MGAIDKKEKRFRPLPKCYHPTFSLNDKVFWAMGGGLKRIYDYNGKNETAGKGHSCSG